MVLLPDTSPDSEAHMGLVVGPPCLDSLGLPKATQTALHNELFNRGLFSVVDVAKNPRDVMGALQAALKIDAERIKNAYMAE
jgi:hypothetical protein